jgi:large repetitive protein
MRISLTRLFALVVVAGCMVALPASASAVATLSGKVYYSPPLGFDIPLEGVDVAVKTQFDAPVKSVKTAADGTWSTTVYGGAGFDYHVYVSNQWGHIWPLSGKLDAHAVDGVTTGNLDFSVRGSSVYGEVFDDVNQNGVQDAGEDGLGDADVTIDGPATRSLKTFSDGSYGVWPPILPAGAYTVSASRAGYTATWQPQPVTAPVGGDGAAPDFGVYWPMGTVAGNVYAETNGEPGRQDSEPGIGDVDVSVSGSYDGKSFTLPAKSQTDGGFSLDVFNGPDRVVTAAQSPAYADGPEHTAVAGAAIGADEFGSVSVPANGSVGAFDFGETGGTISGLTYSDRDADGQRDAGEPATGWRKIDVSGPGFSTTVSSAGNGTYTVRGVPAGDITLTPDTTADAKAPAPVQLHPSVAEALTGKDFGYQFASLTGLVMNRESGSPVGGVTVSLGGPSPRTTTTGDDGSWSFHELGPDTYDVTATPPTGFDRAASTAGNLGGTGGAGAISGIGAGLGQPGSGYVLGLAPAPPVAGGSAPADPAAAGGSAKLATKVKIVARKRTAVRRSRFSLGCKLDAGQVRSCSFMVRSKRGKVLARGKATAKAASARTALTVRVKLTRLGKKLLAKRVAVKVTVTATQAGGPKLKATKRIALRRSGR